jgi:hypothetical protein
MQMDYFRRPQLAGRSLQRLPYGVVRGNVRRSDPDGTSSVPYFPGVSAGQTLLLEVNGDPFTATLTGTPTYQSILNNINTAISPTGIAKDADGSIEISSLLGGGSVRITGGTAAKALGFDIVRSSFFSKGGDLPSSPEGRDGTPFGTAFPSRRENLTTESLTRALGRLSANMDVLYSEHARRDAKFSKIAAGDTAISTPAVGTSLITLPADAQVFTGLGILPSSPTADELAPFVQLIDPITKTPPATCRVVGMVRGAVTGSHPYSAAASFAGAGSVVNVDLVKVSAAIEGVLDGRIVQAPSGVDFTTNGTVVGDWVSITGATNTAPWDNNGYRWVVEEIVDATHLALRPMSQSEFAQANPSVEATDSQPIVELNGQIGGGEAYGTMEVRTGPFMGGVKLVVQPEIPAGATYDVWVSQPKSLRESNAATGAAFPGFAANISQQDQGGNDLLSGFRLSGDASSRTVSAGYIRMRGRLLRVPAVTYEPADLGGDGTYFLYFDESDGRVKTATSLPSASLLATDQTGDNTNPVIRPIAKFVVASAAFSSAASLVRYGTHALERVTVGLGGDFATIDEAAAYVTEVSNTYSETTSTTAYAHFEIVLLNSVSAAAALLFECPGLRLRGANPMVKLTLTGTNQLTLKDNYSFVMEDLLLSCSSTAPLIAVDTQTGANVGTEIYLRRVRQDTGSVTTHVVQGINSGQMKKLVIDDCFLPVNKGISAVDSPITSSIAGQQIFVSRSYLPTISVGATPTMFARTSGDWRGSRLSVRDTVFTGWTPSSGNAPSLMVKTSSADGAIISVNEVKMEMGTWASGADALLIDAESTAKVLIDGLYITGEMPRIVSSSNPDSVIERCVASVRPEGTGTAAIICGAARFCSINGNAPATTRATLIQALRLAVGNTVTGEGAIGLLIPATIANAEASFNNVTLSAGSVAGAAISVLSDNPKLFANFASLTATVVGSFLSAAISVPSATAVIDGCRAVAFGAYAFRGDTSDTAGSAVVANCHFSNNSDAPSGGATRAVAQASNGTRFSLCRFESTSGLPGVLSLTSSANAEIHLAQCFATNELLSLQGSGNLGDNASITVCRAASLAVTGNAFGGTLDHCQFTGNVVLGRSAYASHCKIDGNVTLEHFLSGGRLVLDAITIAGTLTSVGGSADLFIRDCSVTGQIEIGGAQVFSQRNRFGGSSSASISGSKVYSDSDGFLGHGGLISSTSILQIRALECEGALTLAANTALNLHDVQATQLIASGATANLENVSTSSGDMTINGVGLSAKAQLKGCSSAGALTVGTSSAFAQILAENCSSAGAASLGTGTTSYLTCSKNLFNSVVYTAVEVRVDGDIIVAAATSTTSTNCRITGLKAASGAFATMTSLIIESSTFSGDLSTTSTALADEHLTTVQVGGNMSLTTATRMSLTSVFVTGNVTLTRATPSKVLRITSCEFSGTLTISSTSSSSTNARLEVVGLLVAGAVSITAPYANSSISNGRFLSTFSQASGVSTWASVDVTGNVTIGTLRATGISVGGTLTAGISATRSSITDAVVTGAATITTASQPLHLVQCRFAAALTISSADLSMDRVDVVGILAITDVQTLNADGCTLKAAMPSAGTPANTIAVVSSIALFSSVDFRNCHFSDYLSITQTGSAQAKRFTFVGGSLRTTNNLSIPAADCYALLVAGSWDHVAVESSEVFVDNGALSINRPGEGVHFTGVVNFMKINGVTFNQRPMIAGMVDPGAAVEAPGSSFDAIALRWENVNAGTISGCIFDRPKLQYNGSTRYSYAHFQAGTSASSLSRGVVISGCQLIRSTYNTDGTVNSRNNEPSTTYITATGDPGTRLINVGDYDLLFAGASYPDAATSTHV